MAVKRNIYDYCIENEYATPEKIEKAKNYAMETGSSIIKSIIETATLTEEELLHVLGQVYQMKTVDSLSQLNIDPTITSKFDISNLMFLQMIPYEVDDKTIKIVIANPINTVKVEDYIKEVIPIASSFDYMLTTANEIEAWFEQDNSSVSAIEISDNDIVESNTENRIYDVSKTDISSIVTFVNQLFFDAYRKRTSDIHIEPWADSLVIRFRIDGILEKIMQAPKSVHQQIINRIKTMSGMDVNNSRITQDGAIRLKLKGKLIDMRVGIAPTVNGEKATIRMLDNTQVDFNIKMACFTDENERLFREVIERPNGIVLITGPTGSGKSTTLYGTVSELNKTERCIITIEDPVEYKIDGLVQIDVNELITHDFATVFRQTLRQDPNIILVGEIRDAQTAKIAVQASNTGHLVFSTLHTNSASASVTRLIEMGVEPYMVSSTINAVVSQRLVRRICPECKYAYKMSTNSVYRKVVGGGNITLYKGRGCDKCNNTGYLGRIPIQEILVIDEELRNAIQMGATTQIIETLAKKSGMKDIFDDGILKALNGNTTLDEIHRVLHFPNLI